MTARPRPRDCSTSAAAHACATCAPPATRRLVELVRSDRFTEHARRLNTANGFARMSTSMTLPDTADCTGRPTALAVGTANTPAGRTSPRCLSAAPAPRPPLSHPPAVLSWTRLHPPPRRWTLDLNPQTLNSKQHKTLSDLNQKKFEHFSFVSVFLFFFLPFFPLFFPFFFSFFFRFVFFFFLFSLFLFFIFSLFCFFFFFFPPSFSFFFFPKLVGTSI